MGRTPKPWYWEARGAYYATIGGVRHRLGTSKREATIALKGPIDTKPRRVDARSLAGVLDAFLEWTKEHRAPKTYRGYKDFCQSFLDYVGLIAVSDVTPEQVTLWTQAKKTWGTTTKRDAVIAIQRALNWGVNNLGLEQNPIKGMDKPEAAPRTSVITPEEFSLIISHVNDMEFQDLLTVSYDCGARPQEIKALEARHLDLEHERCLLPTEETKGKRRPRAIYVPTERSLEILRRLQKQHPQGRLFRNTRGDPWTTSAVKCRFARLADNEKVGKRFRQYDFRHGWITRKLLAGVDSHLVAKLAGHSSTSMIDKVYSHVADDHEFMINAAKQDIPGAVKEQ